MTVKELYEECVNKGVENYDIIIPAIRDDNWPSETSLDDTKIHYDTKEVWIHP